MIVRCKYGWLGCFFYLTLKPMQEMQDMWVLSLGQEEPLEKDMATHSSILAWRIPWTEEPGGLQSTGPQRVGHNWERVSTHTHTHTLKLQLRQTMMAIRQQQLSSFQKWIKSELVMMTRSPTHTMLRNRPQWVTPTSGKEAASLWTQLRFWI